MPRRCLSTFLTFMMFCMLAFLHGFRRLCYFSCFNFILYMPFDSFTISDVVNLYKHISA